MYTVAMKGSLHVISWNKSNVSVEELISADNIVRLSSLKIVNLNVQCGSTGSEKKKKKSEGKAMDGVTQTTVLHCHVGNS